MSAVEKILREPCAWLTEHESAEIAISSRIRLARNVSDMPFPTAADESTLSSLGQELQTTLTAVDRFGEGSVCSLAGPIRSSLMLKIVPALFSMISRSSKMDSVSPVYASREAGSACNSRARSSSGFVPSE